MASVARPTARGDAPPSTTVDTSKPVTPNKVAFGLADATSRESNPRLSVPKAIVDELLLVCGVIGSKQSDGSGSSKIVPVTDCLNWLQDLQRALRRDDDQYRPVSLLLGRWRVVQQKLLPLVLSCRYDTPLVMTVVKILVILTKPLSDPARRAGRLVVDVTSGKTPDSVVGEQIKLRENAISQSEQLVEYKRLFVHHPSHRRSSKANAKKSDAGGLLSIFVSLLAEPLSKTGTARTDADHLTIELVLHLFRNLLSAEPILGGSSDKSHEHAALHQELVALFDRELVLDVFVVIAQDMESRENSQYNLLLMEILHHLFRNQDPTQVARSALEEKKNTNDLAEETMQGRQPCQERVRIRRTDAGSGSLRSMLSKERRKLVSSVSARHSHFGGTLISQRPDGKCQYLSAGGLSGQRDNKDGGDAAIARRRNRKLDPFIGSGRSSAGLTRDGLSIHDRSAGPAAVRSRKTLHSFCQNFVNKCYGPVMKSLKNEFRRDSVRLEEGDRVVFFRIVWFFCQWWRVWRIEGSYDCDKQNIQEGKEPVIKSAVGRLIFTMDVFTFNLVLTSTDTFHQSKKYPQLEQAAALYTEMMQLLNAMYVSKDPTEHVMALGLMDRLFYGSDPTDRLPKLLSKWQPGTHTREYLCNLVELTHVTIKLLEANAVVSSNDAHVSMELGGRKKKKAKVQAEQERFDAVARMNATAAEFDLNSYLAKKIVSNHIVYMYTRLLSQYSVNASFINNHAVNFLVRLCKFVVTMSDDDCDEGTPAKNPIGLKTSTLEPMLFNIQTMLVFNDILNDASIRNDPDYSSLLSFATVIVRHFAKAAESNPMIHVEALFKHPVPHRFCESVSNMYITEELRMMAEREMLLDEQRQMEDHEEHILVGNDEEPPLDDDEEVEFGDDEIVSGRSKSRRKGEDDKKPVESKEDDSDVSQLGLESNEGTLNKEPNISKVNAPPGDNPSLNKRKHSTGSEEDVRKENKGTAEKMGQKGSGKRIRRVLNESDDSDDEFEVAAHKTNQPKPTFLMDEDDE